MCRSKIVAVVVTYNRKFLLIECIESILNQTYYVDKLIIIDNASTDGTKDLLKEKGYISDERIVYKVMKENTGGAGGFYHGLKISLDINCDWVWIMDDDTIPNKDCLEKLIDADKKINDQKLTGCPSDIRETAYLASSIYGPEGEFMNLPAINQRYSKNGYAYWYYFLKDGIVSISIATFVSILIKKAAIVQCGLPCKDYFIWGDDSEYTLRISTYYGEGYFVGNSVAIHKRIGAKALTIENETDDKRISMFHYLYRNRAIIAHYYKESYHPIRQMIQTVVKMFKYLGKPHGLNMAKAILKGNVESIVQYKRFKSYIDGQLNGKEN